MKLHQLAEQYVRPDVEGTTVTAYHCGSQFEGNFDFRYSGTGEGARILGPGMYLITNKNTALMYTEYARTETAMMLTCEVTLDNFYDTASTPTEKMKASMASLAKELGYDNYRDMPMNTNSMKNGRGFVGDVVKAVGHQKAQQLLAKHGINGAVEHINPAWEICVFNLDCVKIISRDTVEKPEDLY